jgi:thioredoxin 1
MTLRVSTLIVAVALASVASGRAPAATPTAAAPIPALSPAELDSALKAGVPLIVEFGGETCIPCMKMQPVLQDLRTRLGKRARVSNFWIQPNPEVARRHQIMVMPTQIIFDAKGREIFRHMGYFAQPDFEKALKEKGLL